MVRERCDRCGRAAAQLTRRHVLVRLAHARAPEADVLDGGDDAYPRSMSENVMRARLSSPALPRRTHGVRAGEATHPETPWCGPATQSHRSPPPRWRQAVGPDIAPDRRAPRRRSPDRVDRRPWL